MDALKQLKLAKNGYIIMSVLSGRIVRWQFSVQQ